MPSPFPGMNPYLEDPRIWPEIHHRLIVAIADAINPQIRPQYRIGMEERNNEDKLLVGIPDDIVVQNLPTATKPTQSNVAVVEPLVEPVQVTIPVSETIKEWYLEVRRVENGEVITVIEILSPKNKRSGVGRQAYESKRQLVLSSLTNLIEIDLLRQGRMMSLESPEIESDYHILVSRSHCRPQADLYAFNLPDVIPNFPLPLLPEDKEPIINLQDLLHLAYDRGSYDLMIDYQREAVPALSQTDRVWVDRILGTAGN